MNKNNIINLLSASYQYAFGEISESQLAQRVQTNVNSEDVSDILSHIIKINDNFRHACFEQEVKWKKWDEEVETIATKFLTHQTTKEEVPAHLAQAVADFLNARRMNAFVRPDRSTIGSPYRVVYIQ